MFERRDNHSNGRRAANRLVRGSVPQHGHQGEGNARDKKYTSARAPRTIQSWLRSTLTPNVESSEKVSPIIAKES